MEKLACGKSTVDGSYVKGIYKKESGINYIDTTPVHPWSISHFITGQPKNIYAISKLIVENLGNYVNGLDRRNLGVPLMDEVAVMQMKHIVSQIITDPSKKVEMPKYD